MFVTSADAERFIVNWQLNAAYLRRKVAFNAKYPPQKLKGDTNMNTKTKKGGRPQVFLSTCDSPFGAEDEIWTRATITDATPLAGEPLEPLGYFCNASLIKLFAYAESYINISRF